VFSISSNNTNTRLDLKGETLPKPRFLTSTLRSGRVFSHKSHAKGGAMNSIEKKRTEEIRKIHGEILHSLKTSLGKAIRIGELLIKQKERLTHGQFSPWIKNNLPISDRTVQNYMRLYREKDRLKTENVSDLSNAYRLLIEHKAEESFPHIKPLSKDEIKRFRNLEKDIAKRLPKLIDAGKALRIIQGERLYELVFITFEEYCEERWGLKKEDIDFYFEISDERG
jgi:hypothetical protein